MNPVGGSKIFIGLRVASKSEVTASDFVGQDWVEIGGLTNIGQLGDSQELVAQAIISGGRTRQTKGTVVGQVMENTFLPIWNDPGQARFLAAVKSCHTYAFKVEWSQGCEDDPVVDLFYGLALPGSRAGGDANSAQIRNWSIAVDSNVVELSSFSPSDLFAANDVGFLIESVDDARVAGLLWQDSEATIPATQAGDTVALVKDASGGGHDLTLANVVLGRDDNGNYYLSFNGASSSGATAPINFSTSDSVTVIAAIHKNGDAAPGVIAELSNGSGDGRWSLLGPSTTITQRFTIASRGTASVAVQTPSSLYAGPISAVVSARSDISTPLAELWINGRLVGTPSSATQGTGNYSNQPIYVGARLGGSNFFGGRLYGLAVINRWLSDYDRFETEGYMAMRSPAGVARLVNTYELPNSSLASNPTGGFTCTGMTTALPDGTIIIANDGRIDEADLTYNPGLVRLSSDFSAIINELGMAEAYPTPGSIQGVAFDPRDGTIWFCDYANNRVRRCDLAGGLVGTPINIGVLANGLALDASAGELFVSTDSDATILIYETASGSFLRSIEAPIIAIDMLFYQDGSLYLTTGGNGTDGTIIRIDATNGREIRRITGLQNAQAIEAVVISALSPKKLGPKHFRITNDGAFHTNAVPPISAVLEYQAYI